MDANSERMSKVPKASVSSMTYALFDSPSGGELVNETTAAKEVACSICKQVWPSLEMRQHMGFHILHEPARLTSANPCGFCGGDASLCRSWLDTTAKTTNPRTKCVLLKGVAGQEPLKYSHGHAKKMSARALHQPLG